MKTRIGEIPAAVFILGEPGHLHAGLLERDFYHSN